MQINRIIVIGHRFRVYPGVTLKKNSMARLTKMIVAVFTLLLPLLLPAQDGRFSLFDVSSFSGSVIMIQWKVPPLSDFSYYEVERSMDTVNWTRIAPRK